MKPKTGNGMVPWFLLLLLALHGFSLAAEKRLLMHVIDVGQADSILLQTPEGQNVLVDGGNGEDAPVITAYLKRQGVKRLDHVIATHPHEDHIGGLDDVIRAFPVSSFYMPDKAHTTRSFRDLIAAVNESGARKTMAKAGVTLDIPGVSARFLSPVGSGYGDLNDYSAVLRVGYGKAVFMLTGDAGTMPEGEMLKASPADLRADVLKVGHHGSRTSSGMGFLKAVSPKLALISVGKGNDYGHPHRETLAALKAVRATVLRTDESGDLVIATNGSTVTVDKPSNVPSPLAGVQSVYVTDTGSKYHREGCRFLNQSKNPIGLAEALARGYGACAVCKP